MRILIIDDDAMCREGLADHLRISLGHEVVTCEDGESGIQAFRQNPYQLVLSDIRMPGIDGIEVLKQIKALSEGKKSDVVLITGFGEITTAIEAMRAGAFDYIVKPVNLKELEVRISRIAEHQNLLQENYELNNRFEYKLEEATSEIQAKLEHLKSAYAEKIGLDMVGIYSSKMSKVVEMSQILHADRNVPVIIEGETGTGKELVAKMIHYGLEGKETGPFITINCSAISPSLFESELFGYEGGAFTGAKSRGSAGKLELAQGGTLFLDEIADLPLEMQPKLLRVLQEKEIYRVGGVRKIKLDVRIVCATNQNLGALVKDNKFRRDLYYRLNLGQVSVLPLRERREEIKPLANRFLRKAAEQKRKRFRQFDEMALKILESHSWPGNVRELQNAIERVVLLYDDDVVRPGHLMFLDGGSGSIVFGDDTNPGAGQGMYLDISSDKFDLRTLERQVIQKVLARFDNNKTKTAEFFGLSRSTLRRKLSP